jgi:hypothetical protein
MTTNMELLEDVLFAFRCKNERPSIDAVLDWTSRYPRFANEIREAAVLWAEMETQEDLNRPSPDDERLVAEARSAALSALHRASVPRPHAAEARSLAEAVRHAGVTAAELARQMSLPASVVSQVVRGKIMGATIPETFTRMLARLLGREIEWVRGHYPGGVIAAYSAVSGNGQTIGVSTSNSAELTFQESVMDANGIDEAQRRFWLEEA